MRAVLAVLAFFLIGNGWPMGVFSGPMGISGALAGPDSTNGSTQHAPLPGTRASGGLDSFPAAADPPPAPFQSSVCCRVCEDGKACGDTCIAVEETCVEAGGCACDRAKWLTTRPR